MLSKIGCRLRDLRTVNVYGRFLQSPPGLIFCKSHVTSTEKAEKVHGRTEKVTPVNSKEGYQIVYRFPYIVGVRMFSRLKIYQTIVTLALIPIDLVLYVKNLASWNTCLSTFALSTFASVMLFVISNATQKVVGLTAISVDQSTVRFSHLSFFGKRRDVFVPVEDIIPFSDAGENADDIYTKIKLFSNPKFVLYLPMRYGLVENKDMFQLIFGSKIWPICKLIIILNGSMFGLFSLIVRREMLEILIYVSDTLWYCNSCNTQLSQILLACH